MVVRPLEPADVEGCLDLLEAVVNEGLWLGAEPPFDRDKRRERMNAGLEVPTRAQLVATSEDGIVGHLILDMAPYGVAEFGMWVAAGARRQGVGSALVDGALVEARRLGAHKVGMQVWPHNGAALRLYRRHGFVEEGRLHRHYRRANGELWDAVIMGLVLDHERPGSPHPDGGSGG